MPLLDVRGLTVAYDRPGAVPFVAARGVSLALAEGEALGVVGESGCGKSSVMRGIVGMARVSAGTVTLAGADVTNARGRRARDLYRVVQMVFQSPQGSFDPRRTLGFSAQEVLRNAGVPRGEARRRVEALFARCGLDPELMGRYPSEVSGGQCQRTAIARALAARPRLLICDEATSALDTLAQAQVVRLVSDVRDETGMAVLFVCHDLALAQGLCDRVAVMHAGEVVESGPAREVIAHPRHEATRLLVRSARALSLDASPTPGR